VTRGISSSKTLCGWEKEVPLMPEYNKDPQDYAITSKVRIALKVHDETESLLPNIKVGTEHGVVHLMGAVPSGKDKEAVERIARSCNDVNRLVNELQVSS
jgi:osmotically-inducible protein OsmY